MRRTAGVLASTCLLGLTFGAAQGQVGSRARWRAFVHVAGPVDVVGPRRDGSLVVATHHGLLLMSEAGALRPFARGPGGYSPVGGEPYIALASARRLRREHCSFRRDDVFALEIGTERGVVRIDRRGRSHRFADLPADRFPSGIAFDAVGTFGSRLLVTGVAGDTMTLFAFDCRGRPRIVAEGVPKIEGGIAVAPRSFGRFAGHLVGADEHSGRILAVSPGGRGRVVVESGLPAGADIGVESAGFAPRGLGRRVRAFLADPGGQPGPTPGTDSVLTISGRALVRAGVRGGDLLVAREAGGETVRVRCRTRCSVRRIATGPATTHAEGHIAFAIAR